MNEDNIKRKRKEMVKRQAKETLGSSVGKRVQYDRKY